MSATTHCVRPSASVRADSLVGLFASMFPAYAQGNAEARKIIEQMVKIINDPKSTDDEKHAAADTLVEVLFPEPDDVGINLEDATAFCGPDTTTAQGTMDREEEVFSAKLRSLMGKQKLDQKELAERIGVGQPAISMMLKRKCRPQRATVERLAEALGVEPADLWPGF